MLAPAADYIWTEPRRRDEQTETDYPFYFSCMASFFSDVSAELTVIADLGGRDAAPFLRVSTGRHRLLLRLFHHRLFAGRIRDAAGQHT